MLIQSSYHSALMLNHSIALVEIYSGKNYRNIFDSIKIDIKKRLSNFSLCVRRLNLLRSTSCGKLGHAF